MPEAQKSVRVTTACLAGGRWLEPGEMSLPQSLADHLLQIGNAVPLEASEADIEAAVAKKPEPVTSSSVPDQASRSKTSSKRGKSPTKS